MLGFTPSHHAFTTQGAIVPKVQEAFAPYRGYKAPSREKKRYSGKLWFLVGEFLCLFLFFLLLLFPFFSCFFLVISFVACFFLLQLHLQLYLLLWWWSTSFFFLFLVVFYLLFIVFYCCRVLFLLPKEVFKYQTADSQSPQDRLQLSSDENCGWLFYIS